MYTGIIHSAEPVVAVTQKPGLTTLVVRFTPDLLRDLHIGASVALDGVCLTVTKVYEQEVSFDLMGETLTRTTLGDLALAQKVNIERSTTFGAEVGGHLTAGHVSGRAEIVHIDTPKNNYIITLRLPHELMKYVFSKGFIALHGASLTLVDVDKIHDTCTVWLIPETLRLTNFGDKKIGDFLNIEIDSQTQAIVDTVEAYMRAADKS